MNPNDPSDRLCFQEGCFYAHDVVDFGFLDLVRLGVQMPTDTTVATSLAPTAAAFDGNSTVQVTMANGDIYFHRYEHDNYGESNSDCSGWPKQEANRFGRLWPVLSGERGEYELANGRTPRIHWYSLYDLPKAWPATTRHREAEGSSYYRHFYMGLLREDGTPKRVTPRFADYTPEMGICQWFHYDDHRLDEAVGWLKRLGVRYLRTGISWADAFRPNAESWFDRQMRVLEEFDVTVTFCFTPEHRGLQPQYTSPPLVEEEFAEFCCQMLRRYLHAGSGFAPVGSTTAPR